VWCVNRSQPARPIVRCDGLRAAPLRYFCDKRAPSDRGRCSDRAGRRRCCRRRVTRASDWQQPLARCIRVFDKKEPADALRLRGRPDEELRAVTAPELVGHPVKPEAGRRRWLVAVLRDPSRRDHGARLAGFPERAVGGGAGKGPHETCRHAAAGPDVLKTTRAASSRSSSFAVTMVNVH